MGGDEAARNVVTLKEMEVGRGAAGDVKDHEEWKAARFGQKEVGREDLACTLKDLLR